VRLSLKSTSTRTFLIWPALVALEQAIACRPVRISFLPLLPWGYLQYRWSGAYRTRLGGGGPGMSRPPERIVTTGVYGWTRNPMYLGHQIFLAGLALTTRSPLAATLFVAHIPWFTARARDDERELEVRFGAAYESYRRSVPRWFPRFARGKKWLDQSDRHVLTLPTTSVTTESTAYSGRPSGG
jgi:Phospholipid methyltransferase